ncbi:hypothetical protein [Synechococcus sp. M16CYN]
MLTESRAYGRCWVSFAGLEGQLNHSYNLLGHRLRGLGSCGSSSP